MKSAGGENKGRTMCGSVFLQGDKGEKNPEEGSEEHGVGLSHVEAELLAGGSQWKYSADRFEDARPGLSASNKLRRTGF